MMNGNKFAGQLESFDGESTLTLSKNGGPEPDDDGFTIQDTNYENVTADRVFNWKNIESVEKLEDYRSG